MATDLSCPKCNRPNPHKDWLNPATEKQRYRCPGCGHTFYPGAARGRPRSSAPKNMDQAYWNRVDWIRRKLLIQQKLEGALSLQAKQQAIAALTKECEDGNPYAQRILHELQKKFGGDENNPIK